MKCMTDGNSAFEKAKYRQLSDTLDWFLTAIATTCLDKFGMNQDDTLLFMQNVQNIADSIVKNYASVEDYKQTLKEDYNFSIEVKK